MCWIPARINGHGGEEDMKKLHDCLIIGDVFSALQTTAELVD
jgi:hypothetical protein